MLSWRAHWWFIPLKGHKEGRWCRHQCLEMLKSNIHIYHSGFNTTLSLVKFHISELLHTFLKEMKWLLHQHYGHLYITLTLFTRKFTCFLRWWNTISKQPSYISCSTPQYNLLYHSVCAVRCNGEVRLWHLTRQLVTDGSESNVWPSASSLTRDNSF